MMTSSNGNIFRVTEEKQRPVTRSFDVLFDLRLNKRLRKQSRCRWFETPSPSSWRHCNALFFSPVNETETPPPPPSPPTPPPSSMPRCFVEGIMYEVSRLCNLVPYHTVKLHHTHPNHFEHSSIWGGLGLFQVWTMFYLRHSYPVFYVI